ncbi:hypothetical protein V8E51_013331 [Hyaloscypha variabilis]
MPRKQNAICRNCQARHLRCVREPDLDRCRRCTIGDLVCEKGSTFRIRNVVSGVRKSGKRSKNSRDLDYDEDQVWVTIPSRLSFEQHDPSEDADLESTEEPRDQAEQDPQPQPRHISPPLSFMRNTNSAQDEQEFDVHPNPLFSPSAHFLPEPQTHKSPLYEPGPPWSFETSHEAQMFLHYVQRLAGWLDSLDSDRHFAIDIPRRAGNVPVILNAILASASRHIAWISKIEDTESGRYHDKCLQILIPLLDSPVDVLDDNLFAAIIILRQYEEYDEADERCHLFGTARMVDSLAQLGTYTSLREAANWVALRQEIHIALTRRQPVSIALGAYHSSRYFCSNTDDAWGNRMVYLFARVLNFAFAPEGGSSKESWAELADEVEAWNATKPEHFAPLWLDLSPQRDGSPFPEILMLGGPQVHGMQSYCLAKILLATYDPRLLALGFEARSLQKESEKTVLQNLRLIIGLARSNPQHEAAFMHASHILSACGTYFSEREEQDAVIEFLNDIHTRGIWKTYSIVTRLQEQWNEHR